MSHPNEHMFFIVVIFVFNQKRNAMPKIGYSKRKALGYNLLSGATAIVTGVAAYFMLDQMQEGIPYALALSASSFLYIALADLIPEMHRKTSLRASLTQFVLILLGMYLIFINVHH